ncbi:serine/threonine-protein kinase [Dyadobacter jiangsuensis]|uniref:Serine/threonine protein kinase n=1 Tax=Dyadobacter jiangsuensis TaxID=1591085 RepID=A0A2P8G0B8_9BACT|nr:protein kinase [Dyadobacter jiangsuensis]PSL27423.1 serine/threonine protein kinase [Dyadobacter jiangsuensis]
MSVNKILNYNLLHELGKGGMATVWYAENSVGRPFAIKLLKPELVAHEASIAERFRAEAQIMVRLDHPAIRRVEDYYECGTTLAIIMEYLEGQDLHQISRKGRIREEEILQWFEPVLQAFNYVHEKGYFHRDIKPANLFRTSKGQIKVMDFGIAKIMGDDLGLTQTTSLMGSPLYMSPEQILTPRSVDYRTDIYSLGVTLYTLLAGAKPYDDQQLSSFNIQSAIIQQPLPNLTHVSQTTNDVIAKATQKNPVERYHSCAAFSQNLLAKKSHYDFEEATQIGNIAKNSEHTPEEKFAPHKPGTNPGKITEVSKPGQAVLLTEKEKTPSTFNVKLAIGVVLAILITGGTIYATFFDAKIKEAAPEKLSMTLPSSADKANQGVSKAIMFYKNEQYDSSFALLNQYRSSPAFLTNSEAVTDLGIIYYFGGSDRDNIEPDLKEAAAWLKKGSELKNPKAYYYLGLLEDGVDFKQVTEAQGKSGEAVDNYRKAAQGGDSFAQVTLAELYLNDNAFVKQDDPCRILKYLDQAARDPQNRIAELVRADFKKKRFCK